MVSDGYGQRVRYKLGLLLAIPLAVAACGDDPSPSSLPTVTVGSTTTAPTTTVAEQAATSSTAPGTTIATEFRQDHDGVVAFIDAWARGDVDAMRAAGTEDAVETALRFADPTGPTDCGPNQNGQYQCLVDVAGATRMYLLIGEPGAAEGRVWWVAQYVPGT